MILFYVTINYCVAPLSNFLVYYDDIFMLILLYFYFFSAITIFSVFQLTSPLSLSFLSFSSNYYGISITFFFLYPEHPSLVGYSSCSHRDRPVVEKLSRSRGVNPQTLGAQCGTYFGAGEEMRGVVNVCLAKWT